MVPRKEYPHYSSIPARGNEYNSRHRISSNARQDRLEAEPLDIPEDQQSILSKMDIAVFDLANVLVAKVAASSSRQLMCIMHSWHDHRPPVLWSKQ